MSNSDWPTYMGDNQRTGFRPDNISTDLSLAWKQFIGENLWATPSILNDMVLMTGHGVQGIDLKTGEIIWKDEEFRSTSGSATPAVVGDGAYCPSFEYLELRSISDGNSHLRIEPGSIYSSPLVAFDRVFWTSYGQGRRSLYAARLHSTDVLWKHSFDAAIHFSPSADERSIFCASINELHAIDPESGEEKWAWNTGSYKPVGTVLIYRERIFLGLEGYGLVCLNATDGGIHWRLRLPSGLSAPPAVDLNNGLLYAVGNQLRAIDADSGDVIWTSAEYGFNNSAPIVLGEHIFIGGGFDRCFYVFDTTSGKLEWQHPTRDLVYSSAAFASNRILIGSHDGYLYCFELAD